MVDTVLPALEPLPPAITIEEDATRGCGRGYYRAAALRITMGDGSPDAEIGDGGFTDWTCQLLGDAKETVPDLLRVDRAAGCTPFERVTAQARWVT